MPHSGDARPDGAPSSGAGGTRPVVGEGRDRLSAATAHRRATPDAADARGAPATTEPTGPSRLWIDEGGVASAFDEG